MTILTMMMIEFVPNSQTPVFSFSTSLSLDFPLFYQVNLVYKQKGNTAKIYRAMLVVVLEEGDFCRYFWRQGGGKGFFSTENDSDSQSSSPFFVVMLVVVHCIQDKFVFSEDTQREGRIVQNGSA